MPTTTQTYTSGDLSTELGNCGCCGGCCFLEPGYVGSIPATLTATLSAGSCFSDTGTVTLSFVTDHYEGSSTCGGGAEVVDWVLQCTAGELELIIGSNITFCVGTATASSVTCSPAFEADFSVTQTEAGCGCCSSGTVVAITITE